MQFDIITIFPDFFNCFIKESLIKRAQKKGLIEIKTHNLRDYANDKRRSVDDSPYGGGAGMVLMVGPICKAIEAIKLNKTTKKKNKTRTIILTPRGKRFTQKDAQRLTKYNQIIFIAGRYEGIDERVAKFADEEISIGDFVLNGGEIAAGAIIEAVSRLVPGVLGKDASSKEESFSDDDSCEYPQYTRPEIFINNKGEYIKVPEILLSGNHAKIAKWRKENRK